MTYLLRAAVVVGLLATAVASGWGAATTFGAFLEFNSAISSSDIASGRMPLSTKIYDRNDRLLNEVFNETRRSYMTIDQISPFLTQATIATEDASFYRNWGVSPRGIARALWNNLTNRDSFQGGSTITQQLIKNTIIPEEARYERSPERKMREALLALLMTQRYSKNQILEWYLNQVFYGNNSYGIESAAQSYFGKPARELTLAEASMLAGIPVAPAFYDPYARLEQAKSRQQLVLGLMVRHGYISQAQADQAGEEPLHFQPRRFAIEAPHFVMYIRELLETRYGPDALYRGGLKVTTSLDLDLQEQAEAIVHSQIASAPYQRRDAHNGALVSLRPTTGEVLAMVGSADWENNEIGGQVNMALTERQPGSTFKPITYLTSFIKGWAPSTRVLDQPTPFPNGIGGQWVPGSVDGRYFGWVSVRTALAMSLNTPAVLALQYAGVPQTLEMAHRMGITSLLRNDYGLALTLGGGEVKLLDMVYAYSVFANGGVMYGQPRSRGQLQPGMRELDPVVILKVEGPNGKLLEEYAEPGRRQIVPAPYTYLITDILSDNVARTPEFGPNSALVLAGRPAAVKTGTTDDNRDNWTVGYTPDLVTGVWIGNNDYKKMLPDAFGSSTAAPIWNKFMIAALKDTPPRAFDMPPGLVRVPVCKSTGLPAGRGGCGEISEDLFVEGKVPGANGADLVKDRGRDGAIDQRQVDDLGKAIADVELMMRQGKTREAGDRGLDLMHRVQDMLRGGAIDLATAEKYLARLTKLVGTATASPSPATPVPSPTSGGAPSATALPGGTAVGPGVPSPSGTATARPATTPKPPTASPVVSSSATPKSSASPAPSASPVPSASAAPSPRSSPSSVPSGTAKPRTINSVAATATPSGSALDGPAPAGTASPTGATTQGPNMAPSPAPAASPQRSAGGVAPSAAEGTTLGTTPTPTPVPPVRPHTTRRAFSEGPASP